MTDAAVAEEPSEERTYGGLLGAFPYAFRRSSSRLFRSYVVIGGLVALLVAFTFVLALVDLLGSTASAEGGVFTFSRSFYIVVALFVTAPVLAPVLFVARRHRHGYADRLYDRDMAIAGYLFVFSLYVLLVISAPPGFRDPASQYGALAPAIQFLYDLPQLAGLVPPLIAAAFVYLVHRWRR
ncbi:MAG: hypothetical protein ABEI57_06270 [Halapricum sp.]